ncbi:MAG: hypothetical protein K6A45_02945 [Lachnospiraceae bacterium]|nr:hypothetical protein [Lachnospiraceae bacterium]
MAVQRAVKRYHIKEGWIFNLEAMHDKLWCIGNDLDEGVLKGPIEILGVKDINDSSDIQVLIDEAYELESAAKGRGLTGEQYKRAKEMVEWRVMQRYATCLNSGMDERTAGGCFEDM